MRGIAGIIEIGLNHIILYHIILFDCIVSIVAIRLRRR